MATRRYGISLGENEYQVTEAVGDAVNADPIELTVDLANITGFGTAPPPREQVIQALDHLRNYILRGNWPPA